MRHDLLVLYNDVECILKGRGWPGGRTGCQDAGDLDLELCLIGHERHRHAPTYQTATDVTCQINVANYLSYERTTSYDHDVVTSPRAKHKSIVVKSRILKKQKTDDVSSSSSDVQRQGHIQSIQPELGTAVVKESCSDDIWRLIVLANARINFRLQRPPANKWSNTKQHNMRKVEAIIILFCL